MAKPPQPAPVSGARKNVLGRGLSALIPAAAPRAAEPPAPAALVAAGPGSATQRSGPLQVAIEDISPRKGQPRQKFDDAPLNELAESVRALGIVQPIIVTREGSGFVIVAGERRWRAAQRAGLKEVPVVVREATLTQALEMALVENIQRQEFNPLEEAEAYQKLLEEHGFTQEELARRVGKERSTVANAVRLLRLPESVRQLVWEEKLSMGHARALLGLGTVREMEVLGRRIVDRQLSVRATEAMVKKGLPERGREAAAGGTAGGDPQANGEPGQGPAASSGPAAAGPSANVRDLEARLQRALGTRVRVAEDSAQRGRGHLEIHYHSLEELDRLLDRLFTS